MTNDIYTFGLRVETTVTMMDRAISRGRHTVWNKNQVCDYCKDEDDGSIDNQKLEERNNRVVDCKHAKMGTCLRKFWTANNL